MPEEAILAMEKRLAAVEQAYGPRFQVEERMQAILRAAEARAPEGSPKYAELRESSQVQELRELLREASRWGADSEIVDRCMDLLDRSIEMEATRRNAEMLIHRALAKAQRSEAGVELLQEAVAEGKRCGVSTLHAEKELLRLRDQQVQREAAEAELLEAAKGVGPKGRRRWEMAVQHAKSVGVAAEKLQAAKAELLEAAKGVRPKERQRFEVEVQHAKIGGAPAEKVQEEMFRKAEESHQAVRRERSQRDVVERRLRLALKAKDLGEIERSLGQMEPPQSARLMEAASSMLRHLSETNARRQAAVAALQERLAPGAPAGTGAGAEGSPTGQDWLKDTTAVLHEARQCGVQASLIEHARLKVRERLREERDRAQACEALQRTLSKKDAPEHEVLRNLRRLQRFNALATP